MADRKVIEDVPKVAFAPIHDGKYEFTPYPSCLRAVLKHLGRDIPYHYLLSACGGAFRLVWHSEKWDGGNVDIYIMDENPLKPLRRGLKAAGYTFEIMLNGTRPWNSARKPYLADVLESDRERFRKAIIESIDGGIPVISFGVVGPPEASIIAGYDEDGEVLIGWSMFQEHKDPSLDISVDDEDVMNPPTGFEESGYFRQKDWFRRLTGIILLKDRVEVDPVGTYKETLEWIPSIIRTPMAHDYYTGIRAYDEYIRKMGQDEEFPADNMKTLALRKMVHYDAMTMIYERGGGSSFIKNMAENPAFSDAKQDLEEAAEAFAQTSQQMAAWWNIAGKIWSDEEAQIKATADPEIRRKFIPYIEKSRDSDLRAVACIEKALRKLGS